MLKFFWYTITFKKKDYFGRIDRNLDYLKLKKKIGRISSDYLSNQRKAIIVKQNFLKNIF